MLHLSDIPLFNGSVKYNVNGIYMLLTNVQVQIVNYLIMKYNTMSTGATLNSIASYLDTSVQYIEQTVANLVTIKLIDCENGRYNIGKTNLQRCK